MLIGTLLVIEMGHSASKYDFDADADHKTELLQMRVV